MGIYSEWSTFPLAINLRSSPSFEPASSVFTEEMLSTLCTNVPIAKEILKDGKLMISIQRGKEGIAQGRVRPWTSVKATSPL